MMMIKAGAPGRPDACEKLAPFLEPGDMRHRRRQLVVQGHAGAREAALAAKGLHFVGMGVSGGEEGARAVRR